MEAKETKMSGKKIFFKMGDRARGEKVCGEISSRVCLYILIVLFVIGYSTSDKRVNEKEGKT